MNNSQFDKRIFFIQLTETFFESEDLIVIEEVALQENLNCNDLIIFYLKLILKSLKNDGLIDFEKTMTPQMLKAKLRFRSSLNRLEDLKFVDKALILLEEIGLVKFDKNKLFVVKALDYAMNKLESSEKRLQKRRNNKKKIAQLLNPNSSVDPDEEYEEIFKTKLMPGLLYSKYCSSIEEAKSFKEIFDDLYDYGATSDELIKALDFFIKRFKYDIDYHKIKDKKNYLLKTLWNNLRIDVRGNSEEYDSVMERLWDTGLAQNFSDLQEYTSMFKKFEELGYPKDKIAKAGRLTITNLIGQTFKDFHTIISTFYSKMNELLNIQEDKI